MKVLIVDDEKLIRDVIKEYCFENKYDVIEAENGVENKIEEVNNTMEALSNVIHEVIRSDIDA